MLQGVLQRLLLIWPWRLLLQGLLPPLLLRWRLLQEVRYGLLPLWWRLQM